MRTMVKIVARPLNSDEPDLLEGNEQKDFVVRDLEGVVQSRISAPTTGWTHDLLEALTVPEEIARYGCDYLLDNIFIGSTEI